MEIKIMSAWESAEYIPDSPTYAIRIDSDSWLSYSSRHPLKESDKWVGVNKYNFDDAFPGQRGSEKPLSTGDAKKIIKDFERYVPETKVLLVNCLQGRNRSPSIALALNDIFGLGHDIEEMKKMYSGFRGFIYDTMIDAAKELELVD
jgi:hypothetical protein